MQRKTTSILLSAMFFVSFACAQSQSGSSTQNSVPDVTPQIFAPGVISGPASDGAPAFTPDGNTLFFTRNAATWSVILESHRNGDRWSEPSIAPFSGIWNDQQPAMAPDGSHMVFISSRPATTPQASENGANPARSSGIWRVNRAGTGWSEPVRLPGTVNISPRIFKPTIAADGSLYFMSMEKGKKFSLFRSQYAGGTYQQAEPLSFSDGTTGDVDPEIAPDESFLLFSSDGRRPDDTSHEHLYIVFKKAGTWGEVMALRYTGDDANGSSNDNESRLSPDRRTLFFASDRSLPAHFPRTVEQAKQDLDRLQLWDNGNSNVWFMPIAPWLKLGKATANN